jgi:hypothetical protein
VLLQTRDQRGGHVCARPRVSAAAATR